MSAPTGVPTHRWSVRPGKRTGFVLGVVSSCVVLAVAGNSPSARSAASQVELLAPAPSAPVVQDYLSPLRGFEIDEAVAHEHAAIVSRVLAEQIPTPLVVSIAEPRVRVAPVRKEPRMLRRCGYRPSIQQRPDLDSDQKRNANTIIDLSKTLRLPARAAVIGIATAFQESYLRNVNFGDRDSLGLFQQRPSMGWGNKNLVRTPPFAAAAFYVPLVQTPGWRSMPLTRAAQLIQRSAFPDRYAQWELAAATLVKDRLKVPDSALNCKRR